MIRVAFQASIEIGGAQRLGLLVHPDQINFEDKVVVQLFLAKCTLLVPWSNIKYIESALESELNTPVKSDDFVKPVTEPSTKAKKKKGE